MSVCAVLGGKSGGEAICTAKFESVLRAASVQIPNFYFMYVPIGRCDIIARGGLVFIRPALNFGMDLFSVHVHA